MRAHTVDGEMNCTNLHRIHEDMAGSTEQKRAQQIYNSLAAYQIDELGPEAATAKSDNGCINNLLHEGDCLK